MVGEYYLRVAQMSNITYQQELYTDVEDEITALTVRHYKEIAVNKEKIKLNPDLNVYRNGCESGLFKFFTIRDDDKLAGYFVVAVHPHPHYKDHIFAVNDVIFIEKELRDKGFGQGLISFAEEKLKDLGVSVLCINTKVHQPFDKLCEQMDYTLTDRVYTKYIKDEK